MVASVRRHQKLPPYSIDPMPAGSKMDLPLRKVELIGNGGKASGITHIIIRKKTWCARAAEREERECVKERILWKPRSIKKEGKEVLWLLE